ncbi:PREDICTED: histidine triad nucleotide-binding protein 3-like [Priapulus caudatus]|uniref:Adenosine 5'-monophosphoramidase HINT3 n=1 Tax=Priapulus caudatus TaxID=37621 RepID=A0ABM1E8R4_PRICU|nr:PREDICTED: histidine triad nucleotide-binding protein 3-like [Priapulus caudatus]
MASQCIFCKIALGVDEKTKLTYEDEEFVVFPDIRPATKHHYLICPKNHIRDPKLLTRENVPLVERMLAVAEKVLEQQGCSKESKNRRMGFHWPPFNVVQHLHLHVIVPATEMSWLSSLIYRPNSWWFATSDWLLEHLRNLPEPERTTYDIVPPPGASTG